MSGVTVRGVGLELEIGPFGTIMTGDAEEILRAAAAMLEAAHSAGASRVSIRLDFDD